MQVKYEYFWDVWLSAPSDDVCRFESRPGFPYTENITPIVSLHEVQNVRNRARPVGEEKYPLP